MQPDITMDQKRKRIIFTSVYRTSNYCVGGAFLLATRLLWTLLTRGVTTVLKLLGTNFGPKPGLVANTF